jgi:hypothetical protein
LKQTHLEILRKNLDTLNLSAGWVKRSHGLCKTITKKSGYTDQEFDALEVLTSRYARTTDMLVNKVRRSVDIVESEDTGTIIDIMNRAEKRGIVKSAELLHTIKDLRNTIAHEYQISEIPKFFTEVLAYTPALLEIIQNVNEYCGKYLEK